MKFNLLKYLALSVLLTGMLAACSKEEVRKDILSKEQMIPILKDLQVGFAGVDATVKNPRSRKEKYAEINKLILEMLQQAWRDRPTILEVKNRLEQIVQA